jgi:hypothetical protein
MKRPLLFLLVRSRIRMKEVTITPALPQPDNARPKRKTGRLREAAVTKSPMDKIVTEKRV